MLGKINNGFCEVNSDIRKRIGAFLESEKEWLFEKRAFATEVGNRGSSQN